VTASGTVVLDVGKTNAKLSLWDDGYRLVDRQIRANAPPAVPGSRTLDVAGIDRWLTKTLADFARRRRVRRIIPVAHGAAAALLKDGGLYALPLDYEDDAGQDLRRDYAAQRDAFADSGSPLLPNLLNLGLQLHLLERRLGAFPPDVMILPWPQYWAWRLTGIAASEVSSLGCHSDLWNPAKGDFSAMARRRGWARRLAPLVHAGQPLGRITRAIADLTGLPADCEILCGLHDSNAALLAARGHPEIAEREATVLSTGTWFVAMRSPAAGTTVDLQALDEVRDCLVNVDVQGRPVPSARFMGGREAELVGGIDSFDLTRDYEPMRLVNRVADVLGNGAVAYPGFVAGVGPYPHGPGCWRNRPVDADALRIATCLYLALMADTVLDLVGSRDLLLVEGRFAEEVVFTRALAALRPGQRVYVSNAHNDVAYGALRLIDPALEPSCALTLVEPLGIDLRAYAEDWRRHATGTQAVA
jgi:sugar (pentulose or hexulose) kinase